MIVAYTVMSLLAQAFLAAWQASALALAAGAAADPFSQSIIICTPDGLKKVSFGQKGDPVEESKQPGFGLSCSICHIAVCANLAIQPTGLYLDAPLSNRVLCQFANPDCICDRRPLIRHSHDPPSKI